MERTQTKTGEVQGINKKSRPFVEVVNPVTKWQKMAATEHSMTLRTDALWMISGPLINSQRWLTQSWPTWDWLKSHPTNRSQRKEEDHGLGDIRVVQDGSTNQRQSVHLLLDKIESCGDMLSRETFTTPGHLLTWVEITSLSPLGGIRNMITGNLIPLKTILELRIGCQNLWKLNTFRLTWASPLNTLDKGRWRFMILIILYW